MTVSALFAQSASTETANDSIFKGDFYSPRYHVQLVIDLYHESISVPGYEFLGKNERLYERGCQSISLWYMDAH